jgi:hypothetical protein
VDLTEFEASLRGCAPPAGVPGALEALWHERRGDWDRATGNLDDEWRAIVEALLKIL